MKFLFFSFTFLCLIATFFTACHRKTHTQHNKHTNHAKNNKNEEVAVEVGIRFEKSTAYKDILRRAQKEGKPIFIDFYTAWCMPCKMMDVGVFADQMIADLHNNHFINYKVDGESKEGRELIKKFGVISYPTLLYIDTQEKTLHTTVGSLGSQEFLRNSKEVLKTTH